MFILKAKPNQSAMNFFNNCIVFSLALALSFSFILRA